MSVARFPTLAHWGAYTALVENGRVIGCEPFARDPAPPNMLEAIPAMVHSPLRIARPAIRDGWRIIKFPEMALMMVEDRNMGLGCEFVLEKWS